MQKRFLSYALLVLFLNFTVKGTYLLVVEREVQNVLPPGEYGLYFSLFNLSLLFLVVADFGLQPFNNRQLSQNRHLLAKYFPYFIGLKLILLLVFMAALLTAGLILGYNSPTLGLLTIVGLNIALGSLLLFLRTNLSGLGFYRLDSWVSIVDKTLMILLVGSLLTITPELMSVHAFALAQTISLTLACLLVVLLLWSRLKRRLPKFKKAVWLNIMRRAWPYALAIVLMAAYTRIDAVMIERLLTDGELQADHYAAAYRLLDAVNMGGFLLAGLLLPMFARLLGQNKSVSPLLRTAAPLAITGATTISMVLVITSGPVTSFLYDFADARTALILAWLIPAFVAFCGNYIYGSLCTAAALLGPMNRIFTIGVLINFVGNLIVLPKYGAVGCAAVTTITQTFITTALILLAHRRLAISNMAKTWWRTGASLLVLGLCSFALPQVVSISYLSHAALVLALGLFFMLWHLKVSPPASAEF
ncbi:MAG: oligosaccharide flippase family protein [Bacteroidota bacterium]